MSTQTEMLELVAEIHNEFYTAPERLVKSFYELVESKPVATIERGERLKKLGFRNTKEAKETDEYQDKLASQLDLVTKLKEYSQRYPLDKFITEAQVKEICEKYNLVFGKVDRFVGEIPEKNLLEIENRKPLAPEDECWVNNRNVWFGHMNLIRIGGSIGDKLNRLQVEKINDAVEEPKEEKKKEHEYVLQSLHICATLPDMNTRGMELEDGYKLIPDPIVLEETISGLYRVVTAWGPEANDLIVANPALN